MNKLSLLLFSALFISACSTLKVTSDHDPDVSFHALKTFSILSRKVENPDSLNEERIIKAIRRNLIAKGYTSTDSKSASFLVRFQTRSQHDVPSNISFGLGLGTFSGNLGGTIGTSHRNTYDEETLIIEMLNSAGSNTFWQGTATDTVEKTDSPQERQAFVDNLVNALLEKFPARN